MTGTPFTVYPPTGASSQRNLTRHASSGWGEAPVVLQRHLVECVSASAVVAESGLVLALSAPVGPVADVFDGVCVSYREVHEQAAGLR